MTVMSSWKCLLRGCAVLGALSAFSDTRAPVEGRGAGDTFEQAVAVALGDAVLNAGGRLHSEQVVDDEVLRKDDVSASNALHLVEYSVLKRRESKLDGVNATVRATFSDQPNLTNLDGRREFDGTGVGATAREALDWALADLVGKVQTRIAAVQVSEDENLTKDEIDFEHRAYLAAYAGEPAPSGNGYSATVRAVPTPDAGSAGAPVAADLQGRGTGDSPAVARARAREEAVRRLGADYCARELYRDGGFAGRELARRLSASFRDCRVTELAGRAGACEVEVRLRGVNAAGACGVPRDVVGEGYGPTEAAALEEARRDAVLNLDGRIDLQDFWRTGAPLSTESHISGGTYLQDNVLSVEKMPAGGWRAKVSSSPRTPDGEVRASADSPREGTGIAPGWVAASVRARTDAVVGAGASCQVKRAFKDGVLVEDKVEKTRTGHAAGFDIAGATRGGRPSVSARLAAQPASGDVRTGYGEGPSEAEAVLAARYDALLNGGCEVKAFERYEGMSRVQERLELRSSGFVGPASVLAVEPTASGYGARVQAKVWNGRTTPAAPVRLAGAGHGEGATPAAALAAARARMAVDAGLSLRVCDLRYADLRLEGVSLEGGVDACQDGYEIVEARRADGGYRVAVRGGLQYGPAQTVGSGTPVTGWGYGRSAEQAAAVARADAALNARGQTLVRAEWESPQGGVPALSAAWKGDARLLDETDQPQVVKDGTGLFRARVSLKASPAQAGDGKLTVRAHGRGRTLAEALEAARMGVGFNAGARVVASMDGTGPNPGAIAAKWSNDVVFSALAIEKVDRAQDGWIVRVRGTVSRFAGAPAAPKGGTVAGVGFGATAEEAFRAARRSAVLDNGGRGTFSAEEVDGVRTAAAGAYEGRAELRFRKAEIMRDADNGFRATVHPEMLPASRDKLGTVEKKVRAHGFGRTEDEAVVAAKDNAVASVFGRIVSLADGEMLSDEGFVDSFKVKSHEMLPCGLARVEIAAVVKSREQSSMSWWLKGIIIFVVLGVLGALQEKSKAAFALASLAVCVGLFWTGHWIWGTLLALGSIGILKEK